MTEHFSGYLLADIAEKHGDNFMKWFAGQTGAIHNGDLIVYKHDYERWLLGLAPLD